MSDKPCTVIGEVNATQVMLGIGATIRRPKRYLPTPQEDITPIEAYWCACAFALCAAGRFLDAEDILEKPGVARHFTEVNE